ncbi:phosphoenolpyruvate synthase [Paenibacillus sp. GD4]|uniref:phosphoenolpyruvate synthase n=1 Tax=Paenibacillus sp. GD4 TaxID=3068890 RepID=UPI0027965AF5|nr:phosphoenolpyruvate synthase [Paenibacillus sp. GD4]MDQ1913855.1 phosphoenolpyruvate synthase [Paenibacillus sp. GD4]
MVEKYVLSFNEIDKSYLPYVGGKGANLGEMTKAGLPVPQGFCVSTAAYREFIQTSKEMDELFDRLDRVAHDDLVQIRLWGQRIRDHLASLSIPEDIKSSIAEAWEHMGKGKAYAIRSSATAEDLPTASFAGQQDTFLNVRGLEQVLGAVQKCWSSLFTDRAISYRAKNGYNHRLVFLSVVVQQMIFPQASGVMFTADPITGRRHTLSIDASFGLGEALVSGLVTPDLYQVRSGKIVKKNISKKEIAIYSVPEGGTVTKDVPPEKQQWQALSDGEIVELAEWGRKIEAYYGSEQDIEWGLAEGKFYILQSRPITSLYPVPPVFDDRLHIFINFGYLQMMTDPMKPLAISILSYAPSFFQKDPSSQDNPIIREAGGRAFADVTGILTMKPVRNRILKVMKGMDELMASAVMELMERDAFRAVSVPIRDRLRVMGRMAPIVIPVAAKVVSNLLFKEPEKASRDAAAFMENTVMEIEKSIMAASGADRVRLIRQGMQQMLAGVLSKIVVYFITGVIASGFLERKLKDKVGDQRGASLLSQLYKSLPGNVTTEIGLELGDLADKFRSYPEVVAYLQKAGTDTFYEELVKIPGGAEAQYELARFLRKYGMRCAGEIDITKPRWSEDPTQLVPMILSNIRTASYGEHRRKFKQGELDADKAAKEIVAQFGFSEKRWVSRLVKLYRNLLGMREHHKFLLVQILSIYKRAILEEANALVAKGILVQQEDIYFFSLEEMIALLENRYSDCDNIQDIVEERKRQHEFHQKLKSPRVITSEGEIVTGKRRDVKAPEGALLGTPVSAGVVEGVARIILQPEEAKLNPGEILVAPFTDPGWTPLFTSIVGLVTEVGGMMTHGSVIAREYGIPAVVGIERATELIQDGAYIRVDGTSGFVQVLDDGLALHSRSGPSHRQ